MLHPLQDPLPRVCWGSPSSPPPPTPTKPSYPVHLWCSSHLKTIKKVLLNIDLWLCYWFESLRNIPPRYEVLGTHILEPLKKMNSGWFHIYICRAGHTDFGMGGEWSPPIGGGPKGGDKGPMGGDWRVIRDKINGTKKSSLNLWLWAILWLINTMMW